MDVICGHFQINGDENIDELGFGQPQLMKPKPNEIPNNDQFNVNSVLAEDWQIDTPKNETVKGRLFDTENSETPKKRIKNVSCDNLNVSSLKLTPRSYRLDNQYNKVFEMQQEQNDLLKQLVQSNVELVNLHKELLTRMDYMVDCLENLDRKFGDENQIFH